MDARLDWSERLNAFSGNNVAIGHTNCEPELATAGPDLSLEGAKNRDGNWQCIDPLPANQNAWPAIYVDGPVK